MILSARAALDSSKEDSITGYSKSDGSPSEAWAAGCSEFDGSLSGGSAAEGSGTDATGVLSSSSGNGSYNRFLVRLIFISGADVSVISIIFLRFFFGSRFFLKDR